MKPTKASKWPDFLFTIALRLICGMILGGLIRRRDDGGA
jgi:hypothetical protein